MKWGVILENRAIGEIAELFLLFCLALKARELEILAVDRHARRLLSEDRSRRRN